MTYWHQGACAQAKRVEERCAAQLELAWAAGFFEGEGSVTGTLHRGKFRLQLTISQREPSTLCRFLHAVKLGNVTGPYHYAKHGFKPCSERWSYQVYGKKAHEVMQRLMPYVSGPKKERYHQLAEYS